MVGPPLALGIAGLLLEADGRRVATVIAALWIGGFVIVGERLWRWWSLHVLRRTLPSRQRTFEKALSVPVRSFLGALDLLPGDDGGDRRARMLAAREALAALRAPDPRWQALQADWLNLMDDAAADRDGSFLASGNPVADRAQALGARQGALRGREAEWRGLYPVFAPGDAPRPTE